MFGTHCVLWNNENDLEDIHTCEDQPQNGEVYILPDDSEIHNSRIVLQGAEISSTGDDRMVDSFQQHGQNKIRIASYCQQVQNFIDVLAAYGSNTPKANLHYVKKSSIQ